VKQVYDCLKREYIEQRRLRTYSRARRTSPSADPMFWKLAHAVCERNVSPAEYINWCFDLLLERHSDVYANMVCSMNMLARFCEGEHDRKRHLEVLVRVQAHTIRQRERAGEQLDKILLDEDMQVGAIMRYVAARARGRSDLEEVFFEDAKRQVIMRPYYAKLLAKHLPKEMVDG
jgi:hypothetical protein